MANKKQGLKSVKTMASLMDRRRARSAAGALMELSVLANEELRLQQELERSRLRQTEIGKRLAEIADKEARLYGFIKEPPPVARAVPTVDYGVDLRTTEFSY